jgi:hypothetical protein
MTNVNSAATDGGRWYRQPILWLGVAIFCASLAGCIAMVVLGSRYADETLPTTAEHLLKIPATRDAEHTE